MKHKIKLIYFKRWEQLSHKRHKINASKKIWPFTFPYVWSNKLRCAESYTLQLFTIYLQCVRQKSFSMRTKITALECPRRLLLLELIWQSRGWAV